MCSQALQFLDWFDLRCPNRPQLGKHACELVATSLNLPAVENFRDLADKLEAARLSFEAKVNNIVDSATHLELSMQAAPIDTLIDEIAKLPHFSGKSFFFLIDEYENFEDYQQQVVNTLIKHSQSYSFKVGIRELGWRCRTTLNETEKLISPSDYVRIDITDRLQGEMFRTFAAKVCNSRIGRVSINEQHIRDVAAILPSLSEDEEAERLGAASVAQEVRQQLSILVEDKSLLESFTSLELYFLHFLAKGRKKSLVETFGEANANLSSWRQSFDNYKHALLYTIRRRKRGLSKYYCGWPVFVQLAAGNIRYLLELVDRSLILHLANSEEAEADAISAETQTFAAQYVAEKNLKELEGLSVHGARLTRLLLGLGRIFGLMATEAEGHTPEVNQFHLSDGDSSAEDQRDSEQLLTQGTMHLALIRPAGTKLADEGDTRAYDYMVHPIFTPFFVFSYRKKRKMNLSAADLIGLVRDPRTTIRTILNRQNREGTDPLPDQLDFFESYYGDSTENDT